MRATVSFLLLIFTVVAGAATDPSGSSLAWQSKDPIVPADFDAYFPDDEAAAKRLTTAPRPTGEKIAATRPIVMIRQGLRRANPETGNEWIRWLGQQFVWRAEGGQPDADAVELIYQASAKMDYQYTAVYFGLSRVTPKPPALLRRMVEIAMSSEDWMNVIGHTAWATKDNTPAMNEFLEPYLASEKPDVRAHAQVLKRIYTGEITAQDQWKQVHTQRAIEQFGGQMEGLRRRFTDGETTSRTEILGVIESKFLWLNMDERWIEAFRAAASDPQPRVRRTVATLVGTRWFWERQPSDPVNQRALELLIEMSHDADRDVRQNVTYFGLKRLAGNPTAEARVREMESENLESGLKEMREHVLAAIDQRRFSDVESILHEIRPGMKDEVPQETRDKVTQFVKEMEDKLSAARRPNGELQQRIDQTSVGEVVKLGPGTWKGPILIEKSITLQGTSSNQTVLEFQGNDPAVMIRGAEGVRLENLAVRWAPGSTDAKLEYPAAVAVRDGAVVLHSVSLEPIDRPQLTPYGLMAAGRADVQFIQGRSRGFAYALIWQDGAVGKVTDSELRGAGHSVVTIHPESKVEVARNLLADCGYHAVRVTGGTIDMHDNIVMGCARAGAYLGNNNAHGRIYQNLFTGNLGEIWGYARSDVTVDHNVFYRSNDPAIIFRNTCALDVRANSFTGNPVALRQYVGVEDPAKIGVRLDGNHYWANRVAIEPGRKVGTNAGVDDRFQLIESDTALAGDPKYQDPESGDFTPMAGSVLLRNNRAVAGLLDPKAIYQLARRHQLRFAPPGETGKIP